MSEYMIKNKTWIIEDLTNLIGDVKDDHCSITDFLKRFDNIRKKIENDYKLYQINETQDEISKETKLKSHIEIRNPNKTCTLPCKDLELEHQNRGCCKKEKNTVFCYLWLKQNIQYFKDHIKVIITELNNEVQAFNPEEINIKPKK